MAGNLVKWWKCKILGGYNKFSALQECATDSEELVGGIYPMRAASVCSAPPDLLLSSEHMTTSTYSTASPVGGKSPLRIRAHNQHKDQMKASLEGQNHSRSNRNSTNHSNESHDSNRVRLEEFTCDVSVEDSGKKPQPIQFSFTLYDLDGHGKITKDDIAGIVSTIYESIGKTVVVPHYGKKTINVRLTVSPDAKKTVPQTAKVAPTQAVTPIRKKLISDEEEPEDPESDSTTENCLPTTKFNDTSSTLFLIDHDNNNVKNNRNSEVLNNNKFNIYDTINNLKCCNNATSNHLDNILLVKNNNSENLLDICNNCTNQENQPPTTPLNCNIKYQKHSSTTKKKLLRKSRSRRQRSTEVPIARVRSLSVGNENKWKYAHHHNNLLNEQQQLEEKHNLQQKEYQWNNTALRRRELIEIIRDSMEKNRLCFQTNRKSDSPLRTTSQTRHRSHTISKMVSVNAGSGGSANEIDFNPQQHEQNLCGFDSFLHAKICSNLHKTSTGGVFVGGNLVGVGNLIGGGIHLTTTTTANIPSKIHHYHHSAKVNNRTKIQTKQFIRHQAPLKLKSSILNQLNPNLSAEQKMSRKINDVEKWLLERENNMCFYSNDISQEVKLHDSENNNVNVVSTGSKLKPKPRLSRSKSKDEIFAPKDKNLLEIDSKASPAPVTPKKVFNKEILITRKVKNHQKKEVQLKSANLFEYSNVPVNSIDPSECENLISISDDEVATQASIVTAMNLQNAQNDVKPATSAKGNGTTPSNASSATSKSSESTVHRYVHIHHHYHHFENDE